MIRRLDPPSEAAEGDEDVVAAEGDEDVVAADVVATTQQQQFCLRWNDFQTNMALLEENPAKHRRHDVR